MAEITPPVAFPLPTDVALVGYTDETYQRIQSVNRAHVVGLVPREFSKFVGLEPESGNPVYVQTFGVAAVTGAPGVEVLVAHFDVQAERQAWLRSNSSAWFTPLTA